MTLGRVRRVNAGRPNILLVFTDQQQAGMMGCAGNRWLKTPAMDSLAVAGMRFELAFCTNPVCLPSRFSMMTGAMPGEASIRENSGYPAGSPGFAVPRGLGRVLREAGYDAAYGGKVHLPDDVHPSRLGFDILTEDERDGLAESCAEFIGRRRDRPFMLAASFINPHDICYMAIRDHGGKGGDERLLDGAEAELAELDRALALPAGVSRDGFLERHCPPAPANFEPQEGEPEGVGISLNQRPFRRNAGPTTG